MKQGIAIIGCGGIAAAHAAAAAATAVPIVAAIDHDRERAAALAAAAGAAAFGSIDELLDTVPREQLIAAIVCTPPSVRLEIVGRLLAEGIPTLVEKPLAHTVSDAQDLAALASAHPDVPAAVGYCHRFAPAVEEMRRRIALGQLGSLVRFENVFACWHPRMRSSWMSDSAVSGGGSLIDTACHSLDLFAHLVGTPRFAGAVLQHEWPDRAETNATLLVEATGKESKRPVAGVICAGWAEPARFRLDVVGTQGMFVYDYNEATSLRFTGSDGRSETVTVETHESRFARQLTAFLTWAEGRGGRGDLVRFQEAVVVNRVIEDAYAVASDRIVAPLAGYAIAAS